MELVRVDLCPCDKRSRRHVQAFPGGEYAAQGAVAGVMMNRRGFIGSILALGAAPTILRAASLMPVWIPREAIRPATLEEIIVFTFHEHRDEIIENVIRNNALLKALKRNDAINPFVGLVAIHGDIYA